MKTCILTTLISLLTLGNVAADNWQLSVSANNRYLQHADGKPFFWLGDTGWLLPHKLSRQEICQYLSKLESEEKIFLPQSADAAYTELVRMGMPDGEGFSKKTFMKYYRK